MLCISNHFLSQCKYPIQDKPSAQTPKLLADNGLVLRDYQKTSLQWLLDKEQNPTGLGVAGEMWTHMRGREASGGDTSYFYSELTGTFAKDIFDYKNDVLQKDASGRGGDSFPSSAIIGSEMGLGKTGKCRFFMDLSCKFVCTIANASTTTITYSHCSIACRGKSSVIAQQSPSSGTHCEDRAPCLLTPSICCTFYVLCRGRFSFKWYLGHCTNDLVPPMAVGNRAFCAVDVTSDFTQ